MWLHPSPDPPRRCTPLLTVASLRCVQLIVVVLVLLELVGLFWGTTRDRIELRFIEAIVAGRRKDEKSARDRLLLARRKAARARKKAAALAVSVCKSRRGTASSGEESSASWRRRSRLKSSLASSGGGSDELSTSSRSSSIFSAVSSSFGVGGRRALLTRSRGGRASADPKLKPMLEDLHENPDSPAAQVRGAPLPLSLSHTLARPPSPHDIIISLSLSGPLPRSSP